MFHQTLKGKLGLGRGPPYTPVQNYDIILGGYIFITLLAEPSSAVPFKSTTTHGIKTTLNKGTKVW